jgi:hypothetical protein
MENRRCFHTCTSRSRYFIAAPFHSSVHFFSVLVKELYQTESYSLHVMQLISISNTEEYFYFPHLVVLVRYCACEILIANPIDWLYAACLEYFIIFSIDSSEARKQYDEYCLSIMQTITYAHDRTHIRILIAPLVSSNSSQGYVGLCPKNIYSFWIKLFYFILEVASIDH